MNNRQYFLHNFMEMGSADYVQDYTKLQERTLGPLLERSVKKASIDSSSHEEQSKLLVSPSISPTIVLYIIPYITPLLRSLDSGSYDHWVLGPLVPNS